MKRGGVSRSGARKIEAALARGWSPGWPLRVYLRRRPLRNRWTAGGAE